MTISPTSPDLSVVMAAVSADRPLDESVLALEAACAGLSAEILVIGPGDRVAGLAAHHPGVTVRPIPAHTLTPEAWAAGIRQARGRVVALTTEHLVVSPGWARALLAGLEESAAGVGGPMDLNPGSGLVDWAIFYLRYSAFLPGRMADGPVNGEIAGDNAAYFLEDLRRHGASFQRGFWEIEFHQLMRNEGRTLRASSGALAYFGPSFRFGTFLRQRFAHGRQFGDARVRRGERGRAAILAGAPCVPAILAWRAARRVQSHREHVGRFAQALPVFLMFATAWAAGEAAGALFGNSRAEAGDPADPIRRSQPMAGPRP